MLAGFTPAIAQGFVTGAGNEHNWAAVAWFTIGFVIVSGVAALFAPETYKTPTKYLGLSRKQLEEIDRRDAVGEPLTASVRTTPYDR